MSAVAVVVVRVSPLIGLVVGITPGSAGSGAATHPVMTIAPAASNPATAVPRRDGAITAPTRAGAPLSPGGGAGLGKALPGELGCGPGALPPVAAPEPFV
ncbi:hypothetical protein GCM10009610_26770 [Pseudonocardia xinjiangensis]